MNIHLFKYKHRIEKKIIELERFLSLYKLIKNDQELTDHKLDEAILHIEEVNNQIKLLKTLLR